MHALGNMHSSRQSPSFGRPTLRVLLAFDDVIRAKIFAQDDHGIKRESAPAARQPRQLRRAPMHKEQPIVRV
jgi:hypothetical protein